MKVSDLFDVFYGTNLELNRLTKSKHEINFVSRTSRNNGVSAVVDNIETITPLDAGLITVAGGGSVMSSFVQSKPFYSGRDIYCLKSKKQISVQEKIFYCMCLKANKYKYSYGRQANTTLKDLELPTNIPSWINKFDISKFDNITNSITNEIMNLTDRLWRWFSYSEIFDIERGYYNKRPTKKGSVNFVSASSHNNGVTDKIEKKSIEKIYQGNCITVTNNGQYTTCAFYQKNEFTCSHDVNILHIKNKKLTVHIAMFIIPLIGLEKHRFNYGRKWRYQRMLKTKIKLPVEQNNKPDWEFMKKFVSALHYSSNF